MENIVGLLKETCFAKLKSNAVKQEFEKQDELRRSAIRAFVAIYRIRDAGLCFHFFSESYLYFLTLFFFIPLT